MQIKLSSVKKITLVFTWVACCLAFVGVSSVALYSYKRYNKVVILQQPLHPYRSDQVINASDTIVSQVKGLSTDLQTGDARPIIIAEFLKKHDSPLKPYDHYGLFLTELADKYQLDFRLLPSIAMQESNLCKKIPAGSFNCLGLGIHSRGTWTFERYEDNFEAAAKILKEKYIDKGYVTPDEIQDKYTPGSNGSWEYAVNHFMDVLETAEFIL